MRKSLAFAAMLVGIFDSTYLTWAYTSSSHRMVCAGGGCDLVRSSAYAYPFGIPLPIPGLIFYLALAGLALVDAHRPSQRAWKAIAVLSGAGVLFSAWLTYLEAFVIHGFCTWCVVQAICVVIVFALAMSIVGSRQPDSSESWSRKLPVVQYVMLAVAVAAGVPAMYALTKHAATPPSNVVVAPSDAGKLVRSDSHWTGNPEAPLTIVEFGDFQCPSCGVAERTNRAIRDQFGKDVKFVFRQFPLKMHAFAFQAATASECAGQQDKFWPMAETLYTNQADLTAPSLKRYAAGLGLDATRFEACLNEAAVIERINRDIADGTALEVHVTPTFFLNGKKVEGGLNLMEVAGAISAARGGQSPVGQKTTAADKTQARAVQAPFVSEKNSAQPGKSGNTQKAQTRVTSTQQKSPTTVATPSMALGAESGGNPFTTPNGSSPFVPCGLNEKPVQDPPMIHTADMRKLLEDKSAVFVDVRGHAAFKEAHIPSAVNATIEQLEKKIPPELSKDKTVVLYEAGGADDSCTTSKTAGRILMQRGFKEVKVFKEGLDGWQKEGLPVAQ